MDDTEATEPTNQSETADAASAAVPNIRDGARSGLDHEPLTPRKTTLLGRHTATDSYDDGEQTVTETVTDEVTVTDDATPEVADPDGPLDQGGVQVAGGGVEAENADTGEVTQPGEPLPVIEDGTGVALPPADQGSEETGPEGTPIGDAAETASGDGSSDAAGSETPASDDTTSGEQ